MRGALANNRPEWLVASGYSSTFRRRKEFVMTETELKLMAAAARMGLSSSPKKGYSTPAAIGTPTEL